MENDFDIEKQLAEKYEAHKKAVERLGEFRRELASLKDSSANLFEKQLSYISAGALGLSMVVIEKLFKDISITTYKPIIISSWICFGLTLFINLISHLYAGYLHNKSIKDIDDDNYTPQTVIKRNNQIEIVNCVSVIFLLAGICTFIL